MQEVGVLDAMRVADLFGQILHKTLSVRLVAELTDQRVSLPQVHAMRHIWLHHDVLMGDLAQGLGISYPSATNMVKRLERQGLVARTVNPSDRREVEVRLTEKGEAICQRTEDERVARLERVLMAMHEADRDALLRGLQAFIVTAVGDHDDLALDVCLRCGLRASPTCPVAGTHILSICR
ncbi:MAG TPA: MarR family transcriptional regulator [Chthonomonadales bacterium]|nr:MarR family transcriptional regulator [Chthonomonadales bacterium]